MSLVPFLAVAFGGGTMSLLLRRWPSLALGVGLTAIAVAVLAAISVTPGERLGFGGGAVLTTSFVRLFLVLAGWTALVGGIVAVLAMPNSWPQNLPGAALTGLGAAALGLSIADAATAAEASIAAGLAGVIVTARLPLTPRGIGVAARELRALAIAAALVVGAIAWFARPGEAAGRLEPDPAVIGIAYLAVVIGVAVRFGAIPFHLWAARVADAAPEAALPLVLAWLPAVLALVGLAWTNGLIRPVVTTAGSDLASERALVAGIGILSFLFGAVAAWIQDDLEHVVGYSIVQDAGIVVLALASIDPAVWQPARVWIVALVTLRTAFAVWVVAVRGRFGSRRVSGL
ncbi:MAG TPA: proton-conducting transporter membrane subunit, partial [Candidatus Acidoferrum sp.]|nr:proton-conducting transporter membrane subunit [Candidatus Acidoferrum sp.]